MTISNAAPNDSMNQVCKQHQVMSGLTVVTGVVYLRMPKNWQKRFGLLCKVGIAVPVGRCAHGMYVGTNTGAYD